MWMSEVEMNAPLGNVEPKKSITALSQRRQLGQLAHTHTIGIDPAQLHDSASLTALYTQTQSSSLRSVNLSLLHGVRRYLLFQILDSGRTPWARPSGGSPYTFSKVRSRV